MTTLLADIDLVTYDEEVAPEELAELGSFNHSYLQTKLAVLLFTLQEYTALTELSLDVSALADEKLRAKYKDLITPDVSLYSRRTLDVTEDMLKMAEMPLLAIEILSPMQGVQSLIDKVHVYFALGVRSCWIVYPYNRSVTVAHIGMRLKLSFFSLGKSTISVHRPYERLRFTRHPKHLLPIAQAMLSMIFWVYACRLQKYLADHNFFKENIHGLQ